MKESPRDALIVAHPYLVAKQPEHTRSVVLALPTNTFVAISSRYEEALRLVAMQPMTPEQLTAMCPWIDITALLESGLIKLVPAMSRPPIRDVLDLWARIVSCRIRGRRWAFERTIQWSFGESPADSLQDASVVLRLRAAAETARLLPLSSKWCTYVAVALAGALRRRCVSCYTRVLVSEDGTEFHADVLSGNLVCDPAEHGFVGQPFKATAI